MRVWRLLLLLSLLGLTLVTVSRCEPKVDVQEEDDDDDDDDGQVEVEDDVPEQEPAPKKPEYQKHVPKVPTFFFEPFDSKDDFKKRWVVSQAEKQQDEEVVYKYDGKWEVEVPSLSPIDGDLGLVLKSVAKHHAVASSLKKPFEFTGNPLIVQYEVRFEKGMDCGGAYIKLLSQGKTKDLKHFNDKTPYTIMFGPDKCGTDHKIHFIFRHKNPKTGTFEEKHAKQPSGKLDSYFSDKKTHLYKLVVNPDNSFQMYIDGSEISKGNLLEHFSPPVNPPEEIDDPTDKKPENWDDREKIPDPTAVKPDDWDESEPEMITDPDETMPDGWLEDEPEDVPDPDAKKPEDWDEEMDGEWEAPLIRNTKCDKVPGCGKWKPQSIPNPKYKGIWRAPMIDNPEYKGIWKAKRIPNPNFFEDKEPYKMTPIDAIGLELWSMNDNIVFDNFLITDDFDAAAALAADTWDVKNYEERASSSVGGIWNTLMSAAKERQWLWAVYVVVLLLPIVLLSICLCPKAGPIKPEDMDAVRKKTDESGPDDEEAEEEEEKEGEEGEESEEDGGEDAGAGGDRASEEENSGSKKTSKADLEATEENMDAGEEADAEEDEESKGSPKKSPRRRKVRKE